jgi:hypothetical protein
MYPEEFYEFEQMLEGIDEELLLQIAGILVFAGLAILLLAVVVYVFQSIGLYTIAKRRGIQNPWLAWLPIGSEWIAGSIADQYRYVVKGEEMNRRMILLVTSAVGMAVSWLISGVGMENELLDLVVTGLDVFTFVVWQICLYELYTSCNPKNNVLFLVLGIIFPFMPAFFIFANRKKELGMPPRREPEPETFSPEMLDYEEPWKNE